MKGPLAAAIQSMFDIIAQHHSQMVISCESILMREENQSTHRNSAHMQAGARVEPRLAVVGGPIDNH